MSGYALLAVALCFGVAVIIAVCRANRDDLPTIVRAIMRAGPRDDDKPEGPPSLPKP